ncbi:XrtA/PEP-CTERM system TPR-repeat protein PrsT [Herbaspirillum sp. NPDC087042]|uniref:XrtA/PEP-CTERM system TPR-repeat protein PrsT n=1 Tax=Herbaspirillum sp. NPDC087042 TaxID=3364004 RepID=UPI0038011D2C
MVDTKRKWRFSATVCAVILVCSGVTACGRFQSADSLVSEAKQYQQKGDNAAAEIQLKNALQKDADNAEARLLLGKIYAETGNAASADKELRRALALGVKPEQVLPSLARALLMEGQFDKVLEETRSLPVQGDIAALRGNAYLGLGKSDEAKASFEAALQSDPKMPQALIGLARSALLARDVDGANRLTDEALAKNPENTDVMMFKANLLRVQGAQDKALEVLDQVIKLKPDSLEARLARADIGIRSNKFDQAKEDIQAAQKASPKNLLPTYMQAVLDFSQAKNADALTDIQKVLAAAPEYMPAVLLAGAIQYALGSMPQVELNLNKYLDKNPNDVYARKLLASAQLKSGQKAKAAASLEPALKVAPQDPELLALAGEIAIENKDFAKASEYYEKASILAPQTARYHTGLGLSNLGRGQNDSAVSQFQTAASLDTKSPQADILLIMTQIRLKEYDKALLAAKNAEKDLPDNPIVQNLKGGIYMAKNDPANARAAFEKALTIDPAFFAPTANLAQLDLKDNKPDAAKKRFEAVLAKDKKSIPAMSALASLADREKRTQDATQWLERSVNENPDSIQANSQLIGRYLQVGEKTKALNMARKLQTGNPTDAGALEMLAQAQFANDDKQGALASYQRLVQLVPDSAPAQLRLGSLYLANNNPQGAAEAARKALEIQPDFTDAEVFRATMYSQAGDAARALAVAQQMQKKPNQAMVGYELEGNIQAFQKKPDLAAAAFAQAFAMDKQNVRLLMKEHGALLLAGKNQEAAAVAAQWFKSHPNDVAFHLYLGESALAQKQNKVAIDHYQQVLRQQPNNVGALNNLAWAYDQEHDPRAIDTAEKAYAAASDSGPVIDTLGWMLVQKGNTDRGLTLLKKAASLSPDALDIRYHLVLALVQSGDKAAARSELEKILATNKPFPQSDEAKALLGKL